MLKIVYNYSSCCVFNGINFVRLKKFARHLSYIQGQEPERKIREYFYYIDHQGMLFLDDSKMKNFTSCLKDKKFLRFFFNQLRLNNLDRYTVDFPFISICGKERNYVRCDDYPFVFTHVVLQQQQNNLLAYNHAGDLLTLKFEPEKIFMLPENGRVYHPAPERAGGIGLVRSKLAIEFSKDFRFDNGENQPPTHFRYGDVLYQLDTDWYYEVINNRHK